MSVNMDLNRIHVTYMTKAYHDFMKSCEKPKTEFTDCVKDLLETPGQQQVEASADVAPSPAEMTLEEYKQYITDKIASLPLHPSQIKNSVSVHISDAGYEAMKQDPEYEAWVLDTLRREFNFNDPWGPMGGGRYVVHYFGATKEEYRGQSWCKENKMDYRRRMEESYWQKRRRIRKEMQKKYYEDLMERRALIRRIQQQLFIEKGLSWAEAGCRAKMIVDRGKRRKGY